MDFRSRLAITVLSLRPEADGADYSFAKSRVQCLVGVWKKQVLRLRTLSVLR
jgi:hypothetical protein